jgi:plasmid replication initiation protein
MEVTKDSKDYYIIQPNTISRAKYIMPTMVRRLISLVIFTVQVTRPSDMRISIPLHNLALLLGFHKTKRYEELKRAVIIAKEQILQYEEENGKMTEGMHWLTYCDHDSKSDILTIEINSRLYDYVLNIRQSLGFSLILVSDYLKLESKYALRWFEIIMSRSGHADKNDSFFVLYTITEIRNTFSLEEKKYSRMQDFKKRVIENPITEINSKGIGYNIVPEYRYTGKSLTSVFLHCKIIRRTEGNESITALINQNIHKYYICYQEVKKSLNIQNFKNLGAYQMAVMQKAVELLKERLQHE